MAHLDRLRELKYTSPSGKEFRPLWDDLERSGGKKAAVHELPQQNVADVQDLGNQAEKFPLALYFAGADYDQTADAFYAALREKGRATLAHPRWGDLVVLPLTWSQTEAFVDGLRAARFEVEFIEAPDPATLSSSDNTAAAIASAADATATAASAASAAQLVSNNALGVARIKSKVLARVKATTSKLAAIASTVDDVRREIETVGRQIERTIDTLLTTPLTLAQSIVALARLPARTISSVFAKVDGYARLIEDAIVSFTETEVGAAAASALDIIANAIALLESVSEGTTTNRDEAIEIADAIRDAVASALAALEELERSAPGYIIDPSLLALIAKLRAQALAYLLASSLDLPAERVYVTTGERTPIDLAFEIYGTVDELDRLISDNDLAGDELLVIPTGKEIRYYA